MINLDAARVERRADGAVVVRVSSVDAQGRPLPDAVFAFRPGDSQYAKWESRLREQDSPCEPALAASGVQSHVA